LRLHNIKFSSIFLNKFHKIIDKWRIFIGLFNFSNIFLKENIQPIKFFITFAM
jgi:DNA repair protein RadC